tara:strand:+ start:1276 stop:1845 length:570 start_codon:yes stop_codon:yes gene_type:complete
MMHTSSKLNRYYVYVIQDLSDPLEVSYNIFNKLYSFNYKPIYVGRGRGSRYTDHFKDITNPGLEKLKKCSSNNLISEKVSENISWKESVILENNLINSIGRSDLNLGPLVNLTGGKSFSENNSYNNISSLNLELNKLGLILERLNDKRYNTKKDKAKSLGLSERSLYRCINEYKIKKTITAEGDKLYYQ